MRVRKLPRLLSVSCLAVGLDASLPVLLLSVADPDHLPRFRAALAQVTSTDMGAGAAWFDLENDGDLDLLYLTPGGGIVMLRRDAAAFVDVTETAVPLAARTTGRPAVGAAAGDLNNDGFTDLFLTMNGENILLLNGGEGAFRRADKPAGIVGRALSASAALFDADGDGLLDIYVANYVGAANQFYRCLSIAPDGTPVYEEVSGALGMAVAMNGQSNWGLGLAAADFDDDGDVDLYLVNDYNDVSPFGELNPGDNIYYRNNGDGTFTDATDLAGLRDGGWGMGVAAGDYNGDGRLDIYVANFWQDALYRNNGDGTFTDVSVETGIDRTIPYNSWGCAFVDFDNDGDMDIHVANGFIPNDQGQIEDEPDQLWENLGPDGQGVWRFREVGERVGIANRADARGAAYADFNGDGFVDFLVVNNDFVSDALNKAELPKRCFFVNQGDGTFRDLARSHNLREGFEDTDKPSAYRNTDAHHWIQIRPEGTASNRGGAGARVTVRAGGRTWVQELGTGSYCSTNAPFLHFGLGTAQHIDEIEVRFVGGSTGVVRDVSVNRMVVIREDQVTPVRLAAFRTESRSDGVRLEWRVDHDGELFGVRLLRARQDAREVPEALGSALPTEASFLDRDAPTGQLHYTLEASRRDGSWIHLAERTLEHRTGGVLRIGAAFPNPFADAVAIPLAGPVGMPVELIVVDGSGRSVWRRTATLTEGGARTMWDGRDDRGRRVAPGLYFARLAGAPEAGAAKLVVRP